MAEAGSAVKEFFEAYVRATDSADSAFLRSAYGETFMFASPGAVQAVKRDDFLKVVPKRRAFFAAAGLAASDVRGLEETLLDEHHLLVKARWTFRFERDPARPIIEEGAATYILRRQHKRTSCSRSPTSGTSSAQLAPRGARAGLWLFRARGREWRLGASARSPQRCPPGRPPSSLAGRTVTRCM
jgi:hypothetical protein